ncbi:hypothetical protein B0I35DRAFT_413379 [Stachybotrys elegans]|uniref:Heterokaryon incompatibility domain-containing protein n=1 Tax=Stachybotrys elegans TaxID=80388 RepID=A0A8K0SHP9_9HYPO|nr:hypothetical protein B0I35DRAFT_413379 [Stachybotrys elegans]
MEGLTHTGMDCSALGVGWRHSTLAKQKAKRLSNRLLASRPTKFILGYSIVSTAYGEYAPRQSLDHDGVPCLPVLTRRAPELSEAINSMYQWYQYFQVCYVDVWCDAEAQAAMPGSLPCMPQRDRLHTTCSRPRQPAATKMSICFDF